MNIKELIDGTKFHFQKKDAFTVDDVYAIEEQLRNKLAVEIDKAVQKEIANISGKAETNANKLTELNTLIETLRNEKAALEGKVTSYEKELEPVRLQKTQETAKSILGGLVVEGAEIDVYNTLSQKLQGEEFEKAEDKKAFVTPMLEEIFATKPYFKPVVAEPKSDDPSLIAKVKEENKEPEFTGKGVLRLGGQN